MQLLGRFQFDGGRLPRPKKKVQDQDPSAAFVNFKPTHLFRDAHGKRMQRDDMVHPVAPC